MQTNSLIRQGRQKKSFNDLSDILERKNALSDADLKISLQYSIVSSTYKRIHEKLIEREN